MKEREKLFMEIANNIREYLEAEKIFVQNPVRYADVKNAYRIAKQLFPYADKIEIENDPIQMGALFVSVTGYELSMCGEEEVHMFYRMVSRADNYIIYPIENCRVKLSIMFGNALKRIAMKIN